MVRADSTFVDGKQDGFTKFYYIDGRMFEGNAKDLKLEGLSKCITSDGVYEGEYVNGMSVKGTFTSENETMTATYNQGSLHGKGIE